MASHLAIPAPPFMKTYVIAFFVVLTACNTGKKDQSYQPSAADSLQNLAINPPDSLQDSTALLTTNTIPDTILLWTADDRETAFRADSAGARKHLSIMRILNGMKREYPDVPIRFRKIEKDTVVLGFDDNGTYLSQRMGSTGPVVYVNTLALNIFEFANINFIRLEMEEGDHAGPDVITREILTEIKKK
jgi:hypothetical protein